MQLARLLRLLTVIAALLPVLTAQTPPPRRAIAQIGDQTIYDDDLFSSIGVQLWQIKNQEYDLKITAIENLLNQRALENEAKNQGLSEDELLAQAVDSKLSPPTASEVEAYYLAQKSTLNRPLESVKSQLESALTEARLQQARQDYINQLRRKSGAAILLNRPKVEITADPSRIKGNPDAPITIVEFADFQCPYCQSVQPTLKAIMDKYQGKVRLGFRDYPLRQIHPQAQQAAEASRCAGAQGKFWEYHDLLYAKQGKLNLASLKEQARTATLDMAGFEACLANGKFRPLIDSDLQSGSIAGVSGTPAFYINGVALIGAQPLAAFEKVIETALAGAASKQPAP